MDYVLAALYPKYSFFLLFCVQGNDSREGIFSPSKQEIIHECSILVLGPI